MQRVPLPIKRLPKHIYRSFAGIPTRKISHRGLFLQNEGYVGVVWVLGLGLGLLVLSLKCVPIGIFRPNIASPSVTSISPAGRVPKLRPHCPPASLSRVAVSLFVILVSLCNVPIGFMCPDWFLHVPFFSSPCPQITVFTVCP